MKLDQKQDFKKILENLPFTIKVSDRVFFSTEICKVLRVPNYQVLCEIFNGTYRKESIRVGSRVVCRYMISVSVEDLYSFLFPDISSEDEVKLSEEDIQNIERLINHNFIVDMHIFFRLSGYTKQKIFIQKIHLNLSSGDEEVEEEYTLNTDTAKLAQVAEIIAKLEDLQLVQVKSHKLREYEITFREGGKEILDIESPDSLQSFLSLLEKYEHEEKFTEKESTDRESPEEDEEYIEVAGIEIF